MTKVSPLTENGRFPVPETTGGGGPPRVPVKAWTLFPLAVEVEVSLLLEASV